MLELRRLRILQELALRGTLAAVAEALAFSPSAVSQQLALLQREVGVALVEPVGRGLRLTAQGELLAARAAEALAVLEGAETELATSRTEVAGRVRVAVFQSAAHALLPRALSILREQHPQLRVEASERAPEQGLFEVAAGDLDLAIAEQYPGYARELPGGLDRVALATDRIRLGCVDGAFAAREPGGDPLTRFREAPWVMEPQGTASREWASRRCRSAGFEPDVRFEAADLVAHVRLIASGNAVGLIPGLMGGETEQEISLVSLAGDPHREIFTSARRTRAEHPAVVAVRGALAGAVTAVPPEHVA